MKETSADADNVFENFRELLTGDLSDDRSRQVEDAFKRWIEAKLDQYDRDLYSEDEYVYTVIPDEISYQFQGLGPEERYEKAMTAYDRLRVQLLNNETYERARHFLRQEGDVERQKAQAEADLQELREIEKRLSGSYPAVYKQLKRQISESKLDCMYILRDGGASSLRLGREIQRLKQE